MFLVDEIWINELCDRHGEVPPRRLQRTLTRRDVVLGELLDEELRLLDPLGDRPDPHWTPWLARLGPGGIDTARRTAERLANAFLDLDGFGSARRAASPALDIVSRTVAEAVGQVTWVQRRTSDGVQAHGAMLRRPDGTILEDDLDPDEGTHLLALRSGDRGAAMVAAVLDVRPEPGDPSPHPDAGAAHPGGDVGVAAVTVASCHLTVGPPWGSDRPDRRITTHATADGQLWLLDDAAGTGPVRTDAPTLQRLAAELLRV